MLCLAMLGGAAGLSAQSISGDWYFRTLRLGEETDDARVTLKVDGNTVTGSLNELKVDGTLEGDKISLLAKRPDGKVFGSIDGVIHGDTMTGTMRCSPRENVLCDWKATRLDTGPHVPQTYTFVPKRYYRLFSGALSRCCISILAIR